MRWYPRGAAATAATSIVICSAVLAACSPGTETATRSPQPSSSPVPSSSLGSSSTESTGSTGSETPTAAPGQVAVSPNGVTTAVGAPAESTEEEYSRACHAAKQWMDGQGGDPKGQIEPYLKSLQASDAPNLSTYDTPWSKLSPGRQSAVIVAVQAAADGLCT